MNAHWNIEKSSHGTNVAHKQQVTHGLLKHRPAEHNLLELVGILAPGKNIYLICVKNFQITLSLHTYKFKKSSHKLGHINIANVP